MEKTFKVTINGFDENEIKRKVEAMQIILKQVPTEHLFSIVDEIKKNPNVIGKVISIANNPFVKKLW